MLNHINKSGISERERQSVKSNLQENSEKLRVLRLNQPKVTLKEAQEQAKRVMNAKNERPKRLIAKVFQNVEYVTHEDIRKFHSKEWVKKFWKVAGPGNTMMSIPANDPSHGKKKPVTAIYYWDYERFADVVDFKKPTYWD